MRLSKKAAPEKSALENKGVFGGNLCNLGFFDSLNKRAALDRSPAAVWKKPERVRSGRGR
jgi:hypothetical protein